MKTNAVSKASGHTFYVMDASGAAPSRAAVEAACSGLGGQLVDVGEDRPQSGSGSDFAFQFLGQQWKSTWNGTSASPGSSGFSGSV